MKRNGINHNTFPNIYAFRNVTPHMSTDVSELHVSSNFTAEELDKQALCLTEKQLYKNQIQ
jgi:hypothetical protein